jgi:putative two-component system response regulator
MSSPRKSAVIPYGLSLRARPGVKKWSPRADIEHMSDSPVDPLSVRLLVLDPSTERRAELVAQLRTAGYADVLAACDAAGYHAVGEDRTPDLVLLELDRPGVDATALAALRTALAAPVELPILGMTADPAPESRARAAALGLCDVALRPIGEAELRLRIGNALASDQLRRLLSDRDAQLTEALRAPTANSDTVREGLSALAAMADYHDDDSGRHAQRVGCLAAAIAQALELPGASVSLLRAAAPLHDIGKVGISRRILLKPGMLTPPEWLHMQSHVDVGAQILGDARSPVLVLAAEIARTHHERFDGSGYTAGLLGDQIPLSGRIVAVADVWDTLTHDRPYRPAWDGERALAEIQAQAGAHFDPRVVQAFVSLDRVSFERFDAQSQAA